MNKKIFIGLIVLMAISIVGIIAVQLVWMNNAIRVKTEMFNRSVNEALYQTVTRLEDIHNFGVVNEMVFSGDSLTWTHEIENEFDENMRWESDSDSIHVFFDKANKNKKPIRIIREFAPRKNEANVEINVEENAELPGARKTYSYSYHSDSDKKHIIVAGQHKNDNGIIFIQKDTILMNPDSLYAVSTLKIDSLLTDLDEIKLIQPDISKRVKIKASNLKRMANKVASEVSGWDVRRIDEKLIYNVLQKELREKNIPIDFEYGIEQNNKLRFPEVVRDSVKVANTLFKAQLYPNDIFQKNIKLAVFFPEKESFIYRSLNWLLLASGLFSTIILLTFGLSIFYILRQKKVSEMKSDFINNMTHEFKTPIATISVATDSIVNEKVVDKPERIKYFAGMIKKENNRMNRQVEDILTIARLDRKDFEFNWEAIDVHELIRDAIQGIILQIEKRGGKIDLDLSAVNSMVTTDKMHCTNVVYNLIDNANKYSADAPEIKVSTKNLAKGVLLSVCDKGIGMTKTVQAKIFERFYRQTSGNIHNVKGFGLGLSYVKAVLEANKGTISVQSETGKGSEFDVFLPFIRE